MDIEPWDIRRRRADLLWQKSRREINQRALAGGQLNPAAVVAARAAITYCTRKIAELEAWLERNTERRA